MTTPTHETFREQLLDLAYGELDRREEHALRKHLEGCAECAAELARMTSTRSTMAALSDEPAPERGQAVLLAAAREAARAQERRPFLPSWLWGASLSAVGLAAVAALSLQLTRQAPMTGLSGLEKRPAESVAHEPLAAPAPVTALAPTAKEEAPVEASKPAQPPAPAGGKGGGAGPARAAKVSPPRDLELRGEARSRLEDGRGDDRAAGKGDRDGALGALEPEKKQEKAKVAEERVDEGRFAAAPPAEPAPARRQPAASEPPAPAPPANDAELAEAPAAVASAGAAGAPPGREASPQKANALRRRAESPAADALAAPPAAKRARATEDAVARHARLRALGQLRTVARRFPGCAGEAERTVELDPDDQVVKVTRRGTWQGQPYAAELFYGEDGALGAVRWSSEGRVQELRAGPPGTSMSARGVPDAALHPRRAADAGPDAPPRCGD